MDPIDKTEVAAAPQANEVAALFGSSELVERAALLRALLDNAPDIIMHVDLGGRIRFVNRGTCDRSIEDIVGTDWLSFVAPEQRSTIESRFHHVIATGQAAGCEVLAPGLNRSSVLYWTRIGPVWRDGRITGAVLIARDLTEKKRAEAHLAIADRMASMGALAAGVAHEINNPLAALTMNLELAVHDLASPSFQSAPAGELLEQLRDALAAAERVRLIVRDLKLFSRADDDERRGPIDVHRLLESTLRMAWNEIRHRARLIKDWGNVPLVEAVESRLGQVFLNLILNAAQAIEAGAAEDNEIRVRTAVHEDGRVVVTVSDTGCGIPADLEHRIFTPFVTTKPVGVGTGLGLSICHRIVQSLGGEIDFASCPGKGTEFWVVLPAAGLAHSPVPFQADVVTPGRRGRVLVVDDDPLVTHAAQRLLARHHDVVIRDDARLALQEIIEGARFDVILCDLMMPQKSGMEFHDDLQAALPDEAQRIVFVTGGAFTPRARTFLQNVRNHRIEKPFDGNSLRVLIAEMIK